ncbi:MAG TPA: class I SAM-dependent methyltransferase [Candidatus Nanoarchaeia archaeon]
MEVDRSFSLFSELRGYVEVNARLVAKVPGLRSADVVVDIGAGTGLITREAAMIAQNAHILAIEPDRDQIRKATLCVGSCRERVDFIQARAEHLLPGLPESFASVVFFCNAAHLLNDQEREECIQSIHRILRPGGYLVLNTAFATESEPSHTRRYYIRWMKKAATIRKMFGVELDKGERSQARNHVGREDYLGTLSKAGFVPVIDELSEVPVTREGWEAICHYWLFLKGAMPGVDPSIAWPILIMALRVAFPRWPTDAWPQDWIRVWVQLVAQKA